MTAARSNPRNACTEVYGVHESESPMASDANVPHDDIRNACTQACGNQGEFSVCSKTLLVDIRHASKPGVLRGLCIVDEQSNISFCDESVVNIFKPDVLYEDYTLSTMNESIQVKGVSVSGLETRGTGILGCHLS